jgi:hypothetical protein
LSKESSKPTSQAVNNNSSLHSKKRSKTVRAAKQSEKLVYQVKNKDKASQPIKGAATSQINFEPGKYFRTPNIAKAVKAVEAFYQDGLIEFEKHPSFLAVSVIDPANVFWIRRRIE